MSLSLGVELENKMQYWKLRLKTTTPHITAQVIIQATLLMYLLSNSIRVYFYVHHIVISKSCQETNYEQTRACLFSHSVNWHPQSG